jgi:hypothetical protein
VEIFCLAGRYRQTKTCPFREMNLSHATGRQKKLSLSVLCVFAVNLIFKLAPNQFNSIQTTIIYNVTETRSIRDRIAAARQCTLATMIPERARLCIRYR